VLLLEALADEGAADPQVRDLAFRIVNDNGGGFARCTRPTPNNPRQALQAILDALPMLVQYTPDPQGREVFSRVQETLAPVPGTALSPLTGNAKGRDDCEGMATLFSALARAAGLSARPVWIDQEHKGAPLNHVAAVACGLGDHAPAGAVLGSVRFAPAGCAWVEATVPGAIVGESPPEAVARHGLPRVDIAPAGSPLAGEDRMKKSWFAPAGDPLACAVTSAGEAFYLRPTATFTHTGLALQPRGVAVQVLARTQLQQSGSVLYLVRWTGTPYFAAFAPRSLGACAESVPRITAAAGMTASSALALVPGGATSTVGPTGPLGPQGTFQWTPTVTSPLSSITGTTGTTPTPATTTTTPATTPTATPVPSTTLVPTTPETTYEKPAPTASSQDSGLDWKVLAAVGTGLVVAIGVGAALSMRPTNMPRYNPRKRRSVR
jgi:hypothetical protein